MTPRGDSRRPPLRALAGRYSVCRLDPGAPVESGGGGFFALTRTERETSVVCLEGAEPPGGRVESGWRLIEVEGPLEFSAVGILAAISAPLAAAGVPIFVVSTYDTDYVMVREAGWPTARDVLSRAGFTIT